MRIRNFQPDDLAILRQIVADAFDGVSIDQGIHAAFGPVNGHDWKWRKARHLDEDAARDAAGIFVAENEDGRILGCITTWQDREAGVGHIPNLALVPEARGRGLGRALIEHALAHFRRCGLEIARIETLVQNAVGNHLYRDVGFQEVARQVHFAMDLRTSGPSPADAKGA